MTLTLGIETSCDDTAVAILGESPRVISSIVSSQDIHGAFGGVVPEIASRMHMKLLAPMVREALLEAEVRGADLDLVAVTRGPGLIGSLLVGVSFAKAYSYGLGIPLVGVNHVEAHLWSHVLSGREIPPPWIALVVSGGHTELVKVDRFGDYVWLGSTLDDAAGEAFDKVAKLLGLGYPGGADLERLAARGRAGGIRFPRAYLEPGSYDFSFSGLKTAVKDYLARHPGAEAADVAAGFQAAVVEVLVEKSVAAALRFGAKTIACSGGVSNNTFLTEGLRRRAREEGLEAVFPERRFRGDNAAMVAEVGRRRFALGEAASLEMDAEPTLEKLL